MFRLPCEKRGNHRGASHEDGHQYIPRRGRIEEAIMTAIIERTSAKKLRADFATEMKALIVVWQVVED